MSKTYLSNLGILKKKHILTINGCTCMKHCMDIKKYIRIILHLFVKSVSTCMNVVEVA